jgi:hypothetical protein
VSCIKLLELDSIFRGAGAYLDLDPTFCSVFSALFGIGRMPIVYQFWFLRDLFVVSLLAFAIIRYLPGSAMLLWLLFFIPAPMASSLGYYLLGHQLFFTMPPERFPALGINWGYCILWTLIGGALVLGKAIVAYPLLNIGSAAFIFSSALIASTFPLIARFSKYGPSIFFVYAVHEPTQTVLARLLRVDQMSNCRSLACFVFIPPITFLLCHALLRLCERTIPQLLVIATGGR